MNSICIPVPTLSDGRLIEMDVHIGGLRQQLTYRVERIDCSSGSDIDDYAGVEHLRRFIMDYDKSWELVQVGARDGKFVSLLFRRRIVGRT